MSNKHIFRHQELLTVSFLLSTRTLPITNQQRPEQTLRGGGVRSTSSQANNIRSTIGCTPMTSSRGSRQCQFPFEYKNVTYAGCTDVNHSSCWCSFSRKYVSGGWGKCNHCWKYQIVALVLPFLDIGSIPYMCNYPVNHQHFCTWVLFKNPS